MQFMNRFARLQYVLNSARYAPFFANSKQYVRGVQSEAYSHNNKAINTTTHRNLKSVAFFGFPIVLTFSLGVWQVKRLERKKRLIKEREVRLHGSNIEVSEIFNENVDNDYKKVKLSGRFRHDLEMLVGPRSAPKGLPTPVLQWGGSSGLQVITPFELDSGEVILVNRGWIPQRLTNRIKRRHAVVSPHPFLIDNEMIMKQSYNDEDDQSNEKKTFTAIVRRQDETNRFTPENIPQRNEWFHIDPKAMLDQYEDLGDRKRNVVVELIEPLPTIGWPHPRGFDELMQFRTPPSTHVTYAATWFALSGTLALLTRNRFKSRSRKTKTTTIS